MRKKQLLMGLLVVGIALLSGCDLLDQIIDGITGGGTAGGGTTGTGIPWASGEPVSIASQSIGTAGGVVTVSDPGGPLDGMTINVPAGAMPGSTRFDIDYTPIAGTIAPNVDPLTPLITVDNGGDFADDVMTVTIPVTIPAGYFAMGFFVDENGKLEGMPLVAETPTSITVATAHFSSFFIATIADSLLSGTIDTGFRPMTDDWQFVNRGSYIAPGGHCAGQALTAMWYYIEKTQNGTSTLWNRFDNNMDAPATPDLWQDDSLGYRLASVVQKDIDWDNWVRKAFNELGASDDPLNWNAFLYAMLVTGEPQYVAIRNTTVGGGHAMIVYKANADTGTLYIADPNYPGNSSRKIQYANGAFSPYNSGANRAEIDAGNGKAYDEIRYYAKTALVDWSQIAARWDEFDAGTIGDGIFPTYELWVGDDAETAVPLVDGMAFSSDSIEVWISDGDLNISSTYSVWRDDDWITFDGQGRIPLNDGENRLGFYMMSEAKSADKYGDFRWVTVQKTGAGYITIGVAVHGYWEYNQPDTYNPDTELPGVIAYSEDLVGYTNGFVAYANRAFTGNTFTAHWSGYHVGGNPEAEGPYTGSMTVTFSESMDEVISFYASDSQVIDGISGFNHIWSAGGINIPRTQIGNGFYKYTIEKAECCAHINAFSSYETYNSSNNTKTLTGYICDVYSEVGIIWHEEVPEWYK